MGKKKSWKNAPSSNNRRLHNGEANKINATEILKIKNFHMFPNNLKAKFKKNEFYQYTIYMYVLYVRSRS